MLQLDSDLSNSVNNATQLTITVYTMHVMHYISALQLHNIFMPSTDIKYQFNLSLK